MVRLFLIVFTKFIVMINNNCYQRKTRLICVVVLFSPVCSYLFHGLSTE